MLWLIGIVASLCLVPLLVYICWYLFTMKKELKKMHPVETGQISSDIFVIKDDTYINMHLVKTKNGYIAIDTGLHKKVIRREMQKIGVLPEEVHAVFITHTDYDHVKAVALYTKAVLYLPAAEECMINGSTVRSAYIYKNSLNAEYKTVEHKQLVEVDGTRVLCLHTPGHTPGTMSYFVNDAYLFTGDTIQLDDGKVLPASDFFTMDRDQAKRSIEQLASVPGVQYIITAHFGYTDDPSLAFADYSHKGAAFNS